MANSERDHYATVDKKFADVFWEGFYMPKTLPNAVQHFAAMYPDADVETRNAFARVVETHIIMKKVDKRKLEELIDYELSKIDTSRDSAQEKNHPMVQESEKMSVFQADRLDGQSFQEFVAEVLRHTGYTDIEVTGKSGDQGGDVLAKKDGQSIVIQAKRYSIDSKVSNSAVQEAYAAKAYYSTDVGAVITNTLYTKGAKDLASKTGVILWDRQNLMKFIAKYNDRQST